MFRKVAGMTLSTTEKLEKASEMLKAMAHPSRMGMVELLKAGKALNVTEIHEALGLEQAVASQHLAVLKKKGILKAERKGKNTYYSLSNKHLGELLDIINKCNRC